MPFISKKYFRASSPSVFGRYTQWHSVRQIKINLILLWFLHLFLYQPQPHVLL